MTLQSFGFGYRPLQSSIRDTRTLRKLAAKLGTEVTVVAPSLIPQRAGEHLGGWTGGGQPGFKEGRNRRLHLTAGSAS